MDSPDVPVSGREIKSEAEALDEDGVRAMLDSMPDGAARKRWVMERYSAGVMNAEEVAFWFYAYGLSAS